MTGETLGGLVCTDSSAGKSGSITQHPVAANERQIRSDRVRTLAERARVGNAAAFADLYEEFFPRLRQFLDARLRHSAIDAEDVTQETFAKAWNAIGRYDTKHRFSTWLYTIALRTATDHQRRHTVAREHRHGVAVDAAQAPSGSVDTTDEVDNLWSLAKQVLTKDQYAVLWLRFGEDLSIKEVAETLGRSTMSIRVLLFRARGRVREKAAAQERRKVVS
jgi:RNA polymerase sigma-70 factor (ECF subfamily)